MLQYDGPDASPEMREFILRLRKHEDGVLRAGAEGLGKPGTTLRLKRLRLPLQENMGSSIQVLPPRLQYEVMNVVSRLDLVNQEVDDLWSNHQKTFDQSLSKENRARIEANIEQNYHLLTEQLEIFIEKAANALAALGKSRPLSSS